MIDFERITRLHDRVLVCSDPQPKYYNRGRTGIMMAQKFRPYPKSGVVLAVGPGKLLKDGSRRPQLVSKGQTVVWRQNRPEHLEQAQDGSRLVMLREDDLLGVFDKEKA